MGSNVETDERPIHEVHLPNFYISRNEVTVSQYRACVDARACTEPASANDQPACNWGLVDRDNHPVNCVSLG